MQIRTVQGISAKNIKDILEWTNSRGEEFLKQWAGKAWRFPLTEQQILAERDQIYSILDGESFLGIIQILRREENNFHIGRFLLDPAKTGKGLGTIALKQFCNFLFRNAQIESITLNVYAFNQGAQRCYEKCGFKPYETIAEKGQIVSLKMKLTNPYLGGMEKSGQPCE